MYAADTQIYIKISSPEDILSLNETLKLTVHWLTSNQLKLNAKKPEFLLISPPKTNPDIQEWIKAITALNCPPTIVDSAKSLGIALDGSLNMRGHIN